MSSLAPLCNFEALEIIEQKLLLVEQEHPFQFSRR